MNSNKYTEVSESAQFADEVLKEFKERFPEQPAPKIANVVFTDKAPEFKKDGGNTWHITGNEHCLLPDIEIKPFSETGVPKMKNPPEPQWSPPTNSSANATAWSLIQSIVR